MYITLQVNAEVANKNCQFWTLGRDIASPRIGVNLRRTMQMRRWDGILQLSDPNVISLQGQIPWLEQYFDQIIHTGFQVEGHDPSAKLKEDKKPILVNLGSSEKGARASSITGFILDKLLQARESAFRSSKYSHIAEYDFAIILPDQMSESDISKLSQIANSQNQSLPGKVKFTGIVSDHQKYADLVFNSALRITRGGFSLLESLVWGVPTLAIPMNSFSEKQDDKANTKSEQWKRAIALRGVYGNRLQTLSLNQLGDLNRILRPIDMALQARNTDLPDIQINGLANAAEVLTQELSRGVSSGRGYR